MIASSPTQTNKKTRKRRRSSQRYCTDNCQWLGESVGEMVACEQCDNWYHCQCIGISLLQFRRLVRENDDYVCIHCFAADAHEAKLVALDALDKEALFAAKSAQMLLDAIAKDTKTAARAAKHAMDCEQKLKDARIRDANRAARVAQNAIHAVQKAENVAAKALIQEGLAALKRKRSTDEITEILSRPDIVLPPCLAAFIKIPSPPPVVTPQNSIMLKNEAVDPSSRVVEEFNESPTSLPAKALSPSISKGAAFPSLTPARDS